MLAKPSKEHCHYENEKGVKEIEREKRNRQLNFSVCSCGAQDWQGQKQKKHHKVLSC